MRVICRHGHFAFFPREKEDVIHFKRLFPLLPIDHENDYFTFTILQGLPRWSTIGRPFGNFPALFNFEAEHPWQVMEKHGLVFSLATGLLVPMLTTGATPVTLSQSRDYAIAPKLLIQPGAVLLGGLIPGNILLGYQGVMDLKFQRLYIYSIETLL